MSNKFKYQKRLTIIARKPAVKAVLIAPVAKLKPGVTNNSVEETYKLAQSLSIEPFLFVKLNVKKINKKYFIGEGILSYLDDVIKENPGALLLFNCDLSSTWQRNLEVRLCTKVFDRTELILDIFAHRARSFEGKLQVELAKLKHMSTRLVRVWTHLERQKGGIGLRAGPGEKQIETDRRIIRRKIMHIEKKLKSVVKTRSLQRSLRSREKVPTVALVGYTNAGKSTLFNKLTKKKSLIKDMPFASLDTTLGKCFLDYDCSCVIIDTVGFIHDLPAELLNAFRSSLEEVNTADLIVHVLDISDPDFAAHRESTNAILSEILTKDIPKIEVYNKSDAANINFEYDHLYISASNNNGIDALKNKVKDFFT